MMRRSPGLIASMADLVIFVIAMDSFLSVGPRVRTRSTPNGEFRKTMVNHSYRSQKSGRPSVWRLDAHTTASAVKALRAAFSVTVDSRWQQLATFRKFRDVRSAESRTRRGKRPIGLINF